MWGWVGIAQAAPPPIVAAENVYGEAAAAIAGPGAAVRSVLSNPNQDPHEFEASPSVARAIAGAGIVAHNGAGYDPWMDRLLAASPNPARRVLVVAALVGAGPGANPHLWYDPRTMPAFARALAAALAAADPAGSGGYRARLAAFLRDVAPVATRAAALRARITGMPVTATEPVFGDMASALGLVMRNERFQLAVMNDTEPRASDVAAFEADLRGRRVRLLITNAQVSEPTTARLAGIARAAGVPVVGVTETQPPGATYAGWMLGQLDAVAAALGVR